MDLQSSPSFSPIDSSGKHIGSGHYSARPTSSLLRALRSALYSMLTSAAPPAERYVYLELLAIAEDDIFPLSSSACLQRWSGSFRSLRDSSPLAYILSIRTPFASEGLLVCHWLSRWWVHFHFLPRSSSSSSGFGADQRPTRSARLVVVRMARRPLHGFVKITNNAGALMQSSPLESGNTLVILVVLVVFIIAKGNHQATLDAHVVQTQGLPNRLRRGPATMAEELPRRGCRSLRILLCRMICRQLQDILLKTRMVFSRIAYGQLMRCNPNIGFILWVLFEFI